MSEITEVERLLSQATYPGVKTALSQYLAKLKAAETANLQASSLPEPAPAKASTSTASTSSSALPPSAAVTGLKYIPIENFAWDQGSYNGPTVTVYIDLPGVGAAKDRVDCSFGKHSFDLIIHDLAGKNYRLVKDNLEKDIVPGECKFVVKKDKLLLKLQKVKGEYSFESWNQLTSKKPRDDVKEGEKKKDPMGGIMDMMKDMYDEGDENMKKIIGEAMLKSQRGEKSDPKMPSMPGIDDM